MLFFRIVGNHLRTTSALRFNGTAPEPRPGLPSGHIPNSICLPFSLLLQSVQTTRGGQFTELRSPKELREIIAKAIGSDDPIQPGSKIKIVNTCGSGMTAAIIWLALQRLGIDSALYDEVSRSLLTLVSRVPTDRVLKSWMGYGARPESIIATT